MTFSRLSLFIKILALIGLTIATDLATAADNFLEPTFRAGFYTRAFPDFSYEDIEISVKVLGEEIGKQAGIKTTITVFNDINLMRKAFELGEINFVVASTLNLANDFDNKLLADGFKLTPNDPTENLLIITRKNEGLDEFKAARGKRLALVEYDPVADLYIDYLALSTFKKNYQASFKSISREKKAHQIILKLFFGQADVVCVYQNAYKIASELNPQLLSKLQIIAQLRGIPQGAGLFHKNVPAEFREHVITEVMKLETHARGQQFLQLFKADKTIRASLADLTATKQLYIDHQKITKNK